MDERFGPKTDLDLSIVQPYGHCRAGLKVKLWQAVESHSGGTHEYHMGSTSSCQPYVVMAPLVPAWKRVAQNEGGVKIVVKAGVRVKGSRLPLLQVVVMTIMAKSGSLPVPSRELAGQRRVALDKKRWE